MFLTMDYCCVCVCVRVCFVRVLCFVCVRFRHFHARELIAMIAHAFRITHPYPRDNSFKHNLHTYYAYRDIFYFKLI